MECLEDQGNKQYSTCIFLKLSLLNNWSMKARGKQVLSVDAEYCVIADEHGKCIGTYYLIALCV